MKKKVFKNIFVVLFLAFGMVCALRVSPVSAISYRQIASKDDSLTAQGDKTSSGPESASESKNDDNSDTEGSGNKGSGSGGGAVKKAQEGLGKVNPDGKKGGPTLEESIKKIMGAVFFALGIAAVAVIVLGGVTYVTSQGDPGKVKKGRDTIIYGLVGLVVALLAFAIVTFVLNALKG